MSAEGFSCLSLKLIHPFIKCAVLRIDLCVFFFFFFLSVYHLLPLLCKVASYRTVSLFISVVSHWYKRLSLRLW